VYSVELGEAGVVAPDVGVVRIELERLLVLGERAGKIAVGLHGDREVVVGAGVPGVLRDRLLVAEGGLAPETLLGDVGPELDLRVGTLGVGVRRARARDKK
jgi:hypothetical protein